MCYAFENEPFYELTTATRRNAYPYVAKLASINGSVPHDSLQASENVAIASMLNTKYLIIAGIGVTNYDYIEWTKSSAVCNETIPGAATYNFLESSNIQSSGIRLGITFLDHFDNTMLYMCYKFRNDLDYVHVSTTVVRVVSLLSVSNAFANVGLAKWSYANGRSTAILYSF